MGRLVVVGAGPTGAAVAVTLVDQGHEATVVSRRGAGPQRSGITLHRGDASDLEMMVGVAKGADAIFNCANPAYHQWEQAWPPIARSLLGAAEATGATLVTLSNLYAYGPPSGPMTPHDPLIANFTNARVRSAMWRDALEAHEHGRIRAVEVRSSDFIGPHVHGQLSDRAIGALVRGRNVQMMGDVEVPHSWTYVNDVATTLVRCAFDESTWGRAWHVPSNEPRSMHELFDDLADAAGLPRVRVTSVSGLVLRVLGMVNPKIREATTTRYQFEAPFVIDDSETRERLYQWPTPWPLVLNSTLSPYLELSATT